MMRLSILSILIVSSQATRGLKGFSRQSLRSRILENTWNDDNANYTYHFEVESSALSEAEPTNSSSTTSSSSMNVTHIQEMIVSQAQKYKDVVESKAWEFYQSSPSEWTDSQWNFVLMLFGGLLLLSCCCLSSTCAYCCIYSREDKDGPSSNEDRYAKRMWHNRLKRHRSLYRKERYEENDAYTIESQPTFDSGGSISAVSSFDTFGTNTKNDKKQSLLKKSGKTMKSKETKGSYESPKNKRQDTTEQSPGSLPSTFEMENDTPKKRNGRSRTRVEC